jgi:Family of unknown function (DUF5681)
MTDGNKPPSKQKKPRSPKAHLADHLPKFKPGQSGNPNGRPKIPPEVIELARLHTKEAIQTFVDVMQNGSDDRSRVDAADRLLNRAWGKPTEKVEISGDDGGPIETRSYVSGIDFASIRAKAAKVVRK